MLLWRVLRRLASTCPQELAQQGMRCFADRQHDVQSSAGCMRYQLPAGVRGSMLSACAVPGACCVDQHSCRWPPRSGCV